MEISDPSDADSKTLVMMMLKELSEYFNSIKNIQVEMKDILIELKNSLQGINSGMDEDKNQTSDLEHKNIQSEQQEEKKNPKK